MPRLKTYTEATWTAETDKVISVLSVTEASRQLGISPRAISKRRKDLGLNPSPRVSAIRWTKKRDSILGTMNDKDAAEKIGTNQYHARKRRIELGIPAYQPPPVPLSQAVRRPPHRWTAKEDRLLGTQPDPVLAERFDLAPTVVTQRRHELGIAPSRPGAPIEWTKGMLNLLGDVPDGYLAAEYEISHIVVKVRRIQEGILPYGKKYMDTEPDLPRHVISQIGKTPDKVISDKFGVSRHLLRIYRALHGIPCAEARPWALHKWTRKDEALLGTKSDGAVAIQLNIARNQVRTRRVRLGIPAFGAAASIRWSAKRIAQLGTEPDATLARMWNYSQGAIRTKREELGIAKCEKSEHELTPEQTARLGTLSDVALGKEWGVSSSLVRQRRIAQGIPPQKSGKKFNWTDAKLKLLGVIPDEELAVRLGVSYQFIVAKRSELKIPAKRRPRKVDWSNEKIAALLGTMSDYKLGAKLGVTNGAVRSQRLKRKIPAYKPTS